MKMASKMRMVFNESWVDLAWHGVQSYDIKSFGISGIDTLHSGEVLLQIRKPSFSLSRDLVVQNPDR